MDFYLIIHGYYSPAFPQGDVEALSGIAFTPDFYDPENGTWRVSSASGPGLMNDAVNYGTTFTIDGHWAIDALRVMGFP
jgi:hypothetical protein